MSRLQDKDYHDWDTSQSTIDIGPKEKWYRRWYASAKTLRNKANRGVTQSFLFLYFIGATSFKATQSASKQA